MKKLSITLTDENLKKLLNFLIKENINLDELSITSAMTGKVTVAEPDLNKIINDNVNVPDINKIKDTFVWRGDVPTVNFGSETVADVVGSFSEMSKNVSSK